MGKYNKYMTQRSRVVAAVLGICLLFLVSSGTAAPQTPDVKSYADIKVAKDILDSWSGQPELLDRAETILMRVLGTNPKNYLALKEMARYQIMAGYMNDRYVKFKDNVYTVGNFEPGTLDQAEATIRKAISVNEKFAEGYVLLGYIQFEQSKLDDAEKSLTRAEFLKTNDPWLHLNWAAIHEAKGEHSAAEKRWQRVLQTGTEDEKAMQSAYGFLIKNYQQAGKHEEAIALYKDQIQKYPSNAWIRGNFASYLSETLGRNDEAIAEVRAALKIMDYGVGHRTLAMALYRKWADMVAMGDALDADKYFQEAFENFSLLNEVMAYGASIPGGERLAKALVTQKRVPIDARVGDGSTALLIATNRNRAQVVRSLLDLNANPNIGANNGWTPLLSAADEGNIEIVKLLLAKGADTHATLRGRDAAALAELKGNKDIADLLRERPTIQR